MKKRIAVVLCLVMVSMSLAGCSPAETDYLNMSKQMASESYKVTGTLTGEIDFDALAALAQKTTNQDSGGRLRGYHNCDRCDR